MSKKGYKKTKFHTGTVIYTKLIRFPPINPFNKRYSFPCKRKIYMPCHPKILSAFSPMHGFESCFHSPRIELAVSNRALLGSHPAQPEVIHPVR
mgnify:CR=1 FL=1|jgi:hypothetical protein